MYCKKVATSLLVVLTLALTGCGFDIDVEPTSVAYVYKKDINNSTRYNPGSDYKLSAPFATDYQMLTIDYSSSKVSFPIKYTLTDKENKTEVKSKATITYRLMRNPKDNPDLQFSEDETVQYYVSRIKPSVEKIVGGKRYRISPEQVFAQLMNETLDRVFRAEFTNQEKYPDFNAIEANVMSIRNAVKEELMKEAIKVRILVTGVSIESPAVPTAILESRNKMLELQQDQLNTVKELEIRSNLAAGQMAVDVREAINSVVLDRITTGNVNMSYLFLKTLKSSIDSGSPMNLSVTPDFMRYLESDGGNKDKGSDDMFEKLNSMNDQELVEFFSKK